MEPVISIIIAHFNCVDLLQRLLQSIGLHNDVEVIVVDDKSTQDLNKWAVCKAKYEGSQFWFLENTTKTKGAGVSRNMGLAQARGQWLLFADADDVFVTDWYQVVQKYIHCQADIIYFKPSGESTRHKPYELLVEAYLKGEQGAENKLRLQFVPPWSKLIKRSLILREGIGFDDTLYSNDVMFSTKTGFYAQGITASQEVIYRLLEAPDSLTKDKNFDALYIRNEVLCRTYQFLRSHLSKKEFKKAYIRNFPLVNIHVMLKRKYGCKNFLKMYQLYRRYGVPVLASSNFNFKKIIRYLRKHF